MCDKGECLLVKLFVGLADVDLAQEFLQYRQPHVALIPCAFLVCLFDLTLAPQASSSLLAVNAQLTAALAASPVLIVTFVQC